MRITNGSSAFRRIAAVAGAVAVFLAGLLAGTRLRPEDALPSTGAPGVYTGALPDGATYDIQIPAHFNGTLALYSHGYVTPGSLNPAADTGDLGVGAWLVEHGYAVAGSSYAATGWSVRSAIADQMETLAVFDAIEGHSPRHVVAWGHSMGGLVTIALAEEHPSQISGGLALCGIGAGAVRMWDVDLAAMVAFRTLLGPASGLQLVDITAPSQDLQLALRLAESAQSTPEGRARLALVAAVAGIPGWYSPDTVPPATPEGQEQAQYSWLALNDLAFFTEYRAQAEQVAGGNFSSDVGFDFRRAVYGSPYLSEVEALYRSAHLDLESDVAALDQVRPIHAEPRATAYMQRFYSGLPGSPDGMGALTVPLLSVHTTGDGLVPDWNETALIEAVDRAGHAGLLRQLFVAQAGHCTFSDGQTEAALRVLFDRVETGRWGSLSPAQLERMAKSSDPSADVSTARAGSFGFVRFHPPPIP
jgi:pimeloyl-ACP methyl ester carboxylesterase